MNKKLNLTLFILFVAVYSSSTQNDFRSGFIITLENDTINGLVLYRSNSRNYESCIFKVDARESAYEPKQISGFGYVNDKFFSSRIMDGAFVEVLVTGAISLYKSEDRYLIRKDTAIFDLEATVEEIEMDGRTSMKEDTRWRGIISYLISDCLENPNSLTFNLKFDEKSLTQLIVQYNKCTGTEFTEFKAMRPWAKFDFGVTLGLVRSTIKTIGKPRAFSHLDDSYSSIDPSVGVMMTISSPRLTEKFAFQGEVHFTKSSYSSLVIQSERYSTEYHNLY